jgi:hypothetical protein
MSGLSAEMMVSFERWNRKQLPLIGGQKAWKGGTACADVSTHTVKIGAPSNANLEVLGVFDETIDNTGQTAGGATALVNVNFLREKTVLWRDNDGSITSASLFADAYLVDDHTVASTGSAVFGRILAVDAVLGVAVEVPNFMAT